MCLNIGFLYHNLLSTHKAVCDFFDLLKNPKSSPLITQKI
jgi:hypothetical protein